MNPYTSVELNSSYHYDASIGVKMCSLLDDAKVPISNIDFGDIVANYTSISSVLHSVVNKELSNIFDCDIYRVRSFRVEFE